MSELLIRDYLFFTEDKGALWTTVHSVAQSWIRLKQLSTILHRDSGKLL